MGREMAEKLTDRKRRSVVEAAVKEFQRRGFDNTSMDQIAATAGVSKRTVYNHFAGKEDLFAVIIERIAELADVIPEFEFESKKSAESQLRAIGDNIFAAIGEPEFQDLARVVLSRLINAPHASGALEETTNAITMQVTQWFADAKNAGMLNVPRPKVASSQFIGMLMEYEFWPRLIGVTKQVHQVSPKTYVRDCARVIVNAYAPKP